MNVNDERGLYDTDHSAWVAYVAPGMARSLMLQDDDGINRVWSTMGRSYQTAVWALLSAADQERVTRARKGLHVERRRAA